MEKNTEKKKDKREKKNHSDQMKWMKILDEEIDLNQKPEYL